MWPSLPSFASSTLRISDQIDEEVQANLIFKGSTLWGVWLDDSTPNLEHWLNQARGKYVPLGKQVLVAVPPGEPNKHYRLPGVTEVYERYIYGMESPPSAWGPLPKYRAYCIQWRYPGTQGKVAPTKRQRARLLASVMLRRPSYILLF